MLDDGLSEELLELYVQVGDIVVAVIVSLTEEYSASFVGVFWHLRPGRSRWCGTGAVHAKPRRFFLMVGIVRRHLGYQLCGIVQVALTLIGADVNVADDIRLAGLWRWSRICEAPEGERDREDNALHGQRLIRRHELGKVCLRM